MGYMLNAVCNAQILLPPDSSLSQNLPRNNELSESSKMHAQRLSHTKFAYTYCFPGSYSTR